MSWHKPASNSPVAGFLSVSNARARKPCRLQGRSSPGTRMRRFPSRPILELGRFVLEVALEMSRGGFADALVAASTIRVVPGTPSQFRLVPLPLDRYLARRLGQGRTGDVALGHAGNSRDRAAGLDPAYLMGAALHQAIAGPLVPEGLTNREKFSRLLRGRMGLPARLSSAVKAALPRTLLDDATELERLIVDCLEPNPGSRPTPDSARARLVGARGKAGDRAIDPLLGI